MYAIKMVIIIACLFISATWAQQAESFHDKKISLDFQDVQVRAVLQTLAEFIGMNLVVTDAVNGNMTLHLHDVPWDEALSVILKTQNLEKRQTGNILLIDSASALSAREHAILDENALSLKIKPLRSELLQINYAKADDIAVILNDKNSSILSERGTLSVDTRTNTIWLQDHGQNITEVKRLLSRLDVPVKQVQIEARLVNMTKDCSQDLGVRWGVSRLTHISGTLTGASGLANGSTTASIPISDRLNVDLGAMPFEANPASIGIALAKLGDHVLLDLELSALESEGRAEIIASPRLMTTNQQAAVIESGEDIPYQEATLSGATAVSFKKAVLSLKVIPQITPDHQLLMDLQIKQDSDSGRRVHGVPILLTKSIETRVLVKNGQTFVLGGIYKQDKNDAIVRVPFLGSIPVIGQLFSRKQIRKRHEELFIFITPKIVNTVKASTI